MAGSAMAAAECGGRVSLADFKGRKLVLYFYPGADTPRLHPRGIDFSRLRAKFHKASMDILRYYSAMIPTQVRDFCSSGFLETLRVIPSHLSAQLVDRVPYVAHKGSSS
jgi:hypothetical protein